MALIHYKPYQIDLKIVYCGPPGAGKTSCLRALHQSLVPHPDEPIVTLRTGPDRTLFFEFELRNLILIDGFNVHCQLFTVPGTAELNVPHQLVLRDADAIVFVADSQWHAAAENVQSLARLESNLVREKSTLESIPVVIQFNKRDMPDIAPVTYLDFLLNRRSMRSPSFESSTVTGEGVFEALNAALHLAVRQFQSKERKSHFARDLGVTVE